MTTVNDFAYDVRDELARYLAPGEVYFQAHSPKPPTTSTAMSTSKLMSTSNWTGGSGRLWRTA